MSEIDLDAYCRRIGYAGPRAPTLEVLRALHVLHPQAIAFENLNPLLGLPVNIDLGAIQQKLVQSKRGGYCFEQNSLFAAALRAIGFKLAPRAARVVLNVPPHIQMPRTHMALEVEAEGQTYLCDVGFGGLTQTGPAMLGVAEAQTTPHEDWRLVDEAAQRIVQAKIAGEWRTLYRYDFAETLQIDFDVANWYVSTHPSSRFVTGLVAARAVPGKRYALQNNHLAIHRTAQQSDKKTLSSAAELIDVLGDLFALDVPDAARLAQCFERWQKEAA